MLRPILCIVCYINNEYWSLRLLLQYEIYKWLLVWNKIACYRSLASDNNRVLLSSEFRIVENSIGCRPIAFENF
jgi:hypothetical protein